MTAHEFGDRKNPVLMLFPGTMCYRKGNFGHEQDLRHEELLGLYPDDWCALVEKICLPEAPQI